MRKDAFQMREVVNKHLDIKIICQYYDDILLDGRVLKIENNEFCCNVFEQMNPESVEGVYVYAICVGDFSMPEEKILDQLYADIWGTAFVDAVRLVLQEELAKDAELSDSFGPGFYGMDINAMVNIDSILDFSSIGMELKGSQIIVPLKSCAGMYFKVNELYKKINSACSTCLGTNRSCKLCQISGGRVYV
jgi:hypothetical protein